jgi:hypothetical protein
MGNIVHWTEHHQINNPVANMSVPTATTTSITSSSYNDNARRRHLEESYVDAMEGCRSLVDVLAQIDGLGAGRRCHSSSETSSRRPRRRNEVSLVIEVSNQTQEAPTPV